MGKGGGDKGRYQLFQANSLLSCEAIIHAVLVGKVLVGQSEGDTFQTELQFYPAVYKRSVAVLLLLPTSCQKYSVIWNTRYSQAINENVLSNRSFFVRPTLS